MEPLQILSLQREYAMRRNAVKFDYAQVEQNLRLEYSMKLRKQQVIRDEKLLEIDRQEDEMLRKYRREKQLLKTNPSD